MAWNRAARVAALVGAGVATGVAADRVLRRRFRAPELERHGDVVPHEVASFDGTRLHVLAAGPADAPAVVMLHGVTLSAETWHYQLCALADDGRFRAVAYDARGHGRSGSCRGPERATSFTPVALARDLRAVLDGLDVRRCILVGHSMGGMTLLAFAREFPEELGARVAGLVIVNSTFTAQLGAWRPDGRLAGLHAGLARGVSRASGSPRAVDLVRKGAGGLMIAATRTIGFGSKPSPEHVALTWRMVEQTSSETVGAALAGLASFHEHEGLERVDVPVLVVAGSRDLLTPPWLSREMARRLPRAELVELPGVGHMAMLERHAETARLIDEFARKHLD